MSWFNIRQVLVWCCWNIMLCEYTYGSLSNTEGGIYGSQIAFTCWDIIKWELSLDIVKNHIAYSIFMCSKHTHLEDHVMCLTKQPLSFPQDQRREVAKSGYSLSTATEVWCTWQLLVYDKFVSCCTATEASLCIHLHVIPIAICWVIPSNKITELE